MLEDFKNRMRHYTPDSCCKVIKTSHTIWVTSTLCFLEYWQQLFLPEPEFHWELLRQNITSMANSKKSVNPLHQWIVGETWWNLPEQPRFPSKHNVLTTVYTILFETSERIDEILEMYSSAIVFGFLFLVLCFVAAHHGSTSLIIHFTKLIIHNNEFVLSCIQNILTTVLHYSSPMG